MAPRSATANLVGPESLYAAIALTSPRSPENDPSYFLSRNSPPALFSWSGPSDEGPLARSTVSNVVDDGRFLGSTAVNSDDRLLRRRPVQGHIAPLPRTTAATA